MKFAAHRTPVRTAAPFLLMLTLAAPEAGLEARGLRDKTARSSR